MLLSNLFFVLLPSKMKDPRILKDRALTATCAEDHRAEFGTFETVV